MHVVRQLIKSCSDVNTSPPSWEHLHVISNKSYLPCDSVCGRQTIYVALHLRCSVVKIIHNSPVNPDSSLQVHIWLFSFWGSAAVKSQALWGLTFRLLSPGSAQDAVMLIGHGRHWQVGCFCLGMVRWWLGLTVSKWNVWKCRNRSRAQWSLLGLLTETQCALLSVCVFVLFHSSPFYFPVSVLSSTWPASHLSLHFYILLV